MHSVEHSCTVSGCLSWRGIFLYNLPPRTCVLQQPPSFSARAPRTISHLPRTQILNHYLSDLCLASFNAESGALMMLSTTCGPTSGNRIVSRGSGSLQVWRRTRGPPGPHTIVQAHTHACHAPADEDGHVVLHKAWRMWQRHTGKTCVDAAALRS